MEELQAVENEYLDQVIEQQQKVNRELKRKAAPAPAPPGQPPVAEEEHAARTVDYRITGFLLWKTVVVPPNVYIIHTRRGHGEPIHIGLGISFRYNSYTDSFLVVPAAMQTIIINANCICIERQGVMVQAYVQWIIDDIKTAYRRLDFSDPEDPMRIVNVQLREQAEAAIKDKVATMSIDEVLSDKQPIIEELTHRLRAVAEGTRENDSSGLGLKIVTVQIKEAVVSSTRLWQNLQKPFRAEREKLARLAELESQRQIAARELENRKTSETEEMEVEGELSRLRADKERNRYDREQTETARRHKLEQEMEQRMISEKNATEVARKEAELALQLKEIELESQRIARETEKTQKQMNLDTAQAERERVVLRAELEMEELRNETKTNQAKRELALLNIQREIDNDMSDNLVKSRLITALPNIAEKMPQPQELRAVNISSDGGDAAMKSLLGFLGGALEMLEGALKRNREA